ncbi:MAG: META domain-containing protein [Methanotrichaceae archaeon]|nr:META domain-containing protein [Methanotrichaceae archaeon]
MFLSSAHGGILAPHMQSNEFMIPNASAEKTMPGTAREGTMWLLLTYVDSQGKETKVLPGSEVTAVFEFDRLAGNAGCNNYFGSYQMNGSQLNVKVGGATLMYCPSEQLMKQEQEYLLALSNSFLYEIIGNELVISNHEGQPILTYKEYEPTPLNETIWNLKFYNNGRGGLQAPLLGTNITSIFDQKGTLSGTTGCNNYNSDFEVNSNLIKIGPIATTRMFCSEPEGVMEQESSYLEALSLATYYRIQGDELELTDENNTKMATYKGERPQ